MSETLDGKLVIGITTRSLFDLEESNSIFEKQGREAYVAHQRERENEAPPPGAAFPLVKRLLALRSPKTEQPLVDIVLFTRNDPEIGVRIFNATKQYGLDIKRGVFTSGQDPYKYLPAFNVALFLSANEESVRGALQAGIAAATIMPAMHQQYDDTDPQLRIAFDGDAVLFSDEAERVYQQEGLAGFTAHEVANADTPLAPGPFKPFLEGLSRIQAEYSNYAPIRTALITARGALAHKRAITTLRSWNVTIDEAFFLSGLDKRKVIEAYMPHVYFDDQRRYCDGAADIVTTGHVPSGVINERNGQ